MKKSLPIILTLSIFLLICGCANIHLKGTSLEYPAQFSTEKEKAYTVVKSINLSSKSAFVYFNLMTLKNPDFEKAINEEIAAVQGDAIINLQIHGKTTLVDGFIPLSLAVAGAMIAPPGGILIGSLITFRTFTISGDIIRYDN